MMLDVLSELEEIKICTSYQLKGQTIVDFPGNADDLAEAVPVFETLPENGHFGINISSKLVPKCLYLCGQP